MMPSTATITAVLGIILASSASAGEIQIDQVDNKSNRTRYLIVHPRSGRIEEFDRKSNRKSSA